MTPLALVAAAALCAAPGEGTARLAEGRVVFDQLAGRTLEGVASVAPESTPPATGFTLFEVEARVSRRLADGVGAAAFAPDGAVLAVRGSELVALKAGQARVLCEGVLPELSLDPSGRYLALVRPAGADGSAIDLFDLREGRVLRRLVGGPGLNNAPLFAPDGSLLFVSTRTGLSSIWRVGLDGKAERQLTNVGLRRVGPGFVPPMDRARERRFDGRLLLFAAGGERWSMDVQSGAAWRQPGGAR